MLRRWTNVLLVYIENLTLLVLEYICMYACSCRINYIVGRVVNA